MPAPPSPPKIRRVGVVTKDRLHAATAVLAELHTWLEARGIDTRLLQERVDRAAILVVEFALEEARVGEVDQRAALAALVGIEPGQMSEFLVEDLLRSQDGEASRRGEAAGVGIEILDLAQTTRDDLRIVEIDGAADFEREGTQIERHAELPFQRIGRFHREEGIGAAQVEPEIEGQGHGAKPAPSRPSCRASAACHAASGRGRACVPCNPSPRDASG